MVSKKNKNLYSKHIVGGRHKIPHFLPNILNSSKKLNFENNVGWGLLPDTDDMI